MPNSWRDLVKVYPAADLFPMMSDEELAALGNDISKNGLTEGVVLWAPVFPQGGSRKFFLLDGRNRLAAIELSITDPDKRRERIEAALDPDSWPAPAKLLYPETGVDPWSYVVSANVHRRHLTGEQKRELIAKLLVASPERSDRATAKLAKVDHKTVAAVRAEVEVRGEIPHVEIRKDSAGRDQPARKPAIRSAPAAPATITVAAPPPATAATMPVIVGRGGKATFTDKPKRNRVPRAPRSGPPPAHARDVAIVQFALVLHTKPKETLGDLIRLVRDEQTGIVARVPVEHRLAHVRGYIAAHGFSLDGDLKPITAQP
jgi:hypothetical protein